MYTLETKNLKKIYNKIPVVNNINLSINSGDIIGLLGRNGAGKTTTFLMLSGIVKPDSGHIFLNNECIDKYPSYVMAKMGLIYLPQQHSVFLKATVFQNLYQILELYYEENESKKRTEGLLDDFGLAYVRNSRAYQLSGGEKRRLEIARAMIMKPHFLFLDEPFTGIDPITILNHNNRS
jgi:lipopolysaccharide export system ATP-binding protein